MAPATDHRTITPVDSLPPLLTATELLQFLRIPCNRIPERTCRLRRDGLRGIRAGKSFVYPRESVVAYITAKLGK